MKVEDFERAKILRSYIAELEVKQTRVRRMKKRDNDDEFNELRDLAYEGLAFVIRTHESDFSKI